MPISPQLLEVLVCPKCRSRLEYQAGPPEVLVCRESKLVYPIREGIPILLVEEASDLSE